MWTITLYQNIETCFGLRGDMRLDESSPYKVDTYTRGGFAIMPHVSAPLLKSYNSRYTSLDGTKI
jgi:hypothetical protein